MTTLVQAKNPLNFWERDIPGYSREKAAIDEAKRKAERQLYEIPAKYFLERELSEKHRFREVRDQIFKALEIKKKDIPQPLYLQIMKRMDVLLDEEEWDEDDALPHITSFCKLLCLLSEKKNLRSPSIFLNRQGLFTASWRPEKRKLVSLVFNDDDTVNWLVFTPDMKNDHDTIDVAGRAPIQTVLKQVRKHGGLKWMQKPWSISRVFWNG